MLDRSAPTRRWVLSAGAWSAAGAVLVACGGGSGSPDGSAASTSRDDTPDPTDAQAAATAPDGATSPDVPLVAADFDGLGTCLLLPELTAGPFPLDEQFDRRDITEGYPGHPLRLGLRVVDASCEPVPGASVEIWHADASGDYSAFADDGGGKDEGSGSTFLRGTQVADDSGIVEFLTVYPGWYRGRAVHIHVRVHVGDQTVSTSQLFFDDDYTVAVFAEAPYDEFGPPDTTNATDSIAGDPAAEGTLLALAPASTAAGPGTLALLNLGIED